MQEYAKCYLHFEKGKTSSAYYIPKPCREIGESFEESLREGKLVKNLEIF